MLVYLSKKIAIPNDTQLSSLAWHSTRGWLAVGGKNGLLRVLKLEIPQQEKDSRIKGLAAPSVLTMNQTLEAHHSPVVGATWNEKENKLTTCDANGLIVVWVIYKNTWTQEMINNRNKSAVSMIQWNREGQKICIIYEDGAVIVGSVDGNRLWGKDLKGTSLTHVCWSPDSKVLLFGNSKGEILIYDSHGAYNSKMMLHCLSTCTGPVKLVGIDWYNGGNGYVHTNSPCLAVVFDNGCAQIMKHELDDKPVLVNAEMQVTAIAWNQNGSILSLAGSQLHQSDKEISIVQFYSPLGEYMYTLRLPGKGLAAVAWEGTGLRISVGIGGHIFFANIRHVYKWCYFSNTIVYMYRKRDSTEDCAIFWNILTNEKHCKTCHHLLHITSCSDYGLLVTKSDNTDVDMKYALLLCNTLGIPIDTKYLPVEPKHVSISQTHVIASTDNVVYVWHYRTSSRLAAPEFNAIVSHALETHDRLIHVDDHHSGHTDNKVDFSRADKETPDPVCAVCSSDKIMIVGRYTGTIQSYTLPQVTLQKTFIVQCRPHMLALNSDSSKLSIIDNNGILSLYNMNGEENGTRLNLERKEVWDLKWAEDNPEQFAIMEKTRMYIFRGLEPEEPMVSSASICSFKDLQVKAVLMDEVMKDPECPNEDVVFDMDVKSLRDTRQFLSHVTFQDSFQFIHDNPHPRLWRLLAESALEKLEYDMAEKAFVCYHDYQGIQFIKRVKRLDTAEKQRVEVESYFKKFDDAERHYIEMDRKDLALDLRTKLGDWFRVVQLLKVVGGVMGDDTQMTQAWNAIGDYYAERQMWDHAAAYYTQAGNLEKMAESHYILEEYEELEKLSNSLPENHPLLESLADQFVTVGMCKPAITAYLKCHQIKAALDCCVELNQWDEATTLSAQYGMKGVDNLLDKYARTLLDTNRILSTIQLYRKAKYYIEAAQLLDKIARISQDKGFSPYKIKKMFVLCGILVEEYHNYIKEKQVTGTERGKKDEVHSTLQGLLEEDSNVSSHTSLVDTAWRGAEAYHLYMLAQRQLYNGYTEDSMKTTLLLQSYTDILSSVQIYSLLALCSNACRDYYMCSQAFVHLESIPSKIDEDYESLAVEIFRRHHPRGITTPITCPSCDTPINKWTGICSSCGTHLLICMASGHLVQTYNSIQCSCCKHRISLDMDPIMCPLCHSSLNT